MTVAEAIPPSIIRELEFLGVLVHMPPYTKLNPDFDRNKPKYEYKPVVLDENGEPPF